MHSIELIIDGGTIEYAPTTMIDCTGNACVIVRQGKGIASILE
jgi:tRNA A37 threonylcarbamoyladenosine synthetase subunit TsaC/SUA5/YrdC